MNMAHKAKIIAHYLPQFHPVKENNEWFGKGFTEWTSVGNAKPLFKGHYQPKVPSELGYYDLRLPEVREAQAELAKYAGIDAFCYYHYWFGNGKQMLEMPLQEVIKKHSPDFPFCVCWANHSWYRKNWDQRTGLLNQEILLEQCYPGEQDIKDHFYSLLDAFRDDRYYKIHGKLAFVVYNPEFQLIDSFIKIWSNLALKEGLPGFFFIGYSYVEDSIDKYPFTLFDANALCMLHSVENASHSFIRSQYLRIRNILSSIIGIPLGVYNYSKILSSLMSPSFGKKNIYPVIIPNWDTTPRRGSGAMIFKNTTPSNFKLHLEQVLNSIDNKDSEDQIVFLKSWNEWGEGNYVEPDLKFGRGYLDVISHVLKGE